MTAVKEKVQQTIQCPQCNHYQVAIAELLDGSPWWSHIHTCDKCEYVIMESEWQALSPVTVLNQMQAENERLKAALHTANETIDAVTRGHEATRVENERLRLLLAPLARLDLTGIANKSDDHPVYQRNDTVITVGHVRESREALGVSDE